MALSPAELAALQAAQLADANGVAAPAGPPLPTPGAQGQQGVQPYTVTNQSLGPSTTSGSSTKIENPLDIAARNEDIEANRKLADVTGEDITAPPNLSPEEIAATPESQRQSALSMQRQAQTAPPSNAANLPPVMGIPLAQGEKGAPPAGHEFTSQEFNASTEGASEPGKPSLVGGIAGPRTLSQEKDQQAAIQASLAVKLKQEEDAKRAEVAKQAHDAMVNWQKDFDKARADAEKASKITTLQQDRSGIQNFLSAIAVGMGAYGAIRGHSQNFAQDILAKQVDDDFRAKKENLEFQVKRLDRLGVDRQRLDQFEDREMQKFLAAQTVKVDKAKAVAQQAFSRFPEAQHAAEIATAQAQAKVAGIKAEQLKGVGERTATSSSQNAATTVQTVDGKDSQSGQGRINPDAVDQLVRARQNAKNMNGIKEKDLPTGEEWNQLLRNEHAIIAQNSSEVEGGIKNVKAGDFMRWIGAMPTNIYPANWSDEKRESARVVLEQAHALFAKRWTPGSISQPEAYAHGMGPLLPQPGDKPAVIRHKFGELKDYANGLATEMEKVLPAAVAEHKVNAREEAAKANPTEPPKFTPVSKEDRAAALKFARENPKDPRSIAAMKKIAESDRAAARR